MQRLRILVLALAVTILFIPMALVIRKFSTHDISSNLRVSFSPTTCYACKDCPCKYLLNNGESYTLSSRDKKHCTTDHEKINEGIEKNLDQITVEMSVKQYQKFYDCVKWYSLHPTVEIK